MQLPLDLLLALRYLRPRRNFISIITILSVLGPVLGVALLLIVSSVMAGFDKNIQEKYMEVTAHITVFPPPEAGFFPHPQPLLEKLEQEGRQWGLRGAPVIEGPALVQVRDAVEPKFIRGILPEADEKVTRLQRHFSREGHALQEGEAAVGNLASLKLGLRQGDSLLIHSPARLTQNIHWEKDGRVKFQEPDELYLPEEVRVAAFFSMGISDVDDNVLLLHLDQAADLFGLPWGSATSLQLAVDTPLQAAAIAQRLRPLHPQCQFVTWQEQNPVFFNAIQNEKSLMTFLMSFIVVVASFAITATLITVVVQKTREIGVLKAVGVSSACVGRIFLFQGLIIGATGTALGTALGLLILHYRDAIARLISLAMGSEIFPEEIYQLSSIPALTTPQDLIRTILLSLSVCVGAALVPALFAAAANPAQSLKSET